MLNKSTKSNSDCQTAQAPIAGLLPGDFGVEIFGIKETRKVFFLTNGGTAPFAQLPGNIKAQIFEDMLADARAMADLCHLEHDEALEEYAFCIYGQADGNADFINGIEADAQENFVCGPNCRCLNWHSKEVMLNGQRLTVRQVQVAQELATDLTDIEIAHNLHISTHTLRSHKDALYSAAGVASKSGFTRKAITSNIA